MESLFPICQNELNILLDYDIYQSKIDEDEKAKLCLDLMNSFNVKSFLIRI